MFFLSHLFVNPCDTIMEYSRMPKEPMSKEKAQANMEKARSIISEMKEMLHYSESNIEKFGEFWLFLSDEMKRDEFSSTMEEILATQNKVHELVDAFVDNLEMDCNRIENED